MAATKRIIFFFFFLKIEQITAVTSHQFIMANEEVEDIVITSLNCQVGWKVLTFANQDSEYYSASGKLS